MRIFPGNTVLDMGCGPGIDTVILGSIVGETGKVFGIDHDPEMVVAAESYAQAENVDGWMKHQQGSALALPFEDEMFDACRSERVFQHLPEPAEALSELIRVTKPSGWIVIVETDWSTLT